MKEKIYTIPLTKALDKDCDCPLCHIEQSLDTDAVRYFLGPAMMEPDTRSFTNRVGFCRAHYDKMLSAGNKLSLSLILQTRLESVVSELKRVRQIKKTRQKLKNAQKIGEMFSSCAACERVSDRMRDCTDNFVYLLQNEPDFNARFFASKGLCMKHFNSLVTIVSDNEVFDRLLSMQICALEKTKSEIDTFCNKFDYRNAGLDIKDIKMSPAKAASKLRSLI